MQKRIKQLIEIGQERMERSTDAYHGMDHAKRVVENAKTIAHSLHLTSAQRQAVILAGWWHDTGRTLTKKPSVIWMRCIDDMLSAFLLWKESIKVKEFSQIVSLAIRIILCSNIGTGKFLIRILLRKKDRILLSILKDSDTLDTICTARLNYLCEFARQSKTNQLKYQFAIWWFLHSKEFQFRTEKAWENFEMAMQEFLVWVREINNFEWHKQTFGLEWIENSIASGEKILEKIQKRIKFS